MSNRGILLTGASGTIGQYILKNLLESGSEVALLVRDRGQSNARQRVEKLISNLDLRSDFPNPRVITWDLLRDGSQMPSEDKNYLIHRVNRILHCAASVQFQEDPRSGEPWRSNVEGTSNLLQLATEIGGVHFYHVSTAYVCGAHHGAFLESTDWAPTVFNNVYEQSKYQAEKLVLDNQSRLASVTILRPSIVVGDSSTGQAPTFNTLYAGLRFAAALSENDTHSIPSLLQGMHLDGHATKNVVPVNWVAEMISEIISNDHLAGRVYHLTHDQPISVAHICQAMIEAIAREPDHWAQLRQMTKSSLPLDDAIASYLKPFQSYFKNDPEFDSRNIAPLKEKHPLPLMDQNVLVKLFRFAIRSLLRSQPHASVSQARSAESIQSHPMDPAERKFVPTHSSEFGEQEGCEDRSYVSPGSLSSSVHLHSATWSALVEGKLSLRDALRLGAVVVCGPLDLQSLAIEELRRKLEQEQLSRKPSMPIDTWPTDQSLLAKGVLHG